MVAHLFSMTADCHGWNSVTTTSVGKDRNVVICIFLESVQNRFRCGCNFGFLCFLILDKKKKKSWAIHAISVR